MTNALPPLANDRIEAFAASAVLWLVRLLGVLLAPGAARRRRLLRRFVLRIERSVACIVFLKAVMRSVPPPPRPHPRSVPPGFRRTRGGARLLWKSARIAVRNSTLIDRVGRLLEALADSEPYVVHFMKRLARGLCLSRLVACAPPTVALCAGALAPTSFADSS